MTAFAIGVDILFRDPNLAVDAVWKAGGSGAGKTVRVIRRAPDDTIEWRESRLRTPTVFLDVRVSEAVTLSKGDTFEIDGATFTVTGAPERDSLRLVWKAEAREG